MSVSYLIAFPYYLLRQTLSIKLRAHYRASLASQLAPEDSEAQLTLM